MSSSLIYECENWLKNQRSKTPELDKLQKRLRWPKKDLAKEVLIKDAHEKNLIYWHLRAFMTYLGGNHLTRFKLYCAANELKPNGNGVEIWKPDGLCFLIHDGLEHYLGHDGSMGARAAARRILESDVRSILEAAQVVYQNRELEVCRD